MPIRTIIRLLMDRTWAQRRAENTRQTRWWRTSTLADLDREYTLNDICIIPAPGPGPRIWA